MLLGDKWSVICRSLLVSKYHNKSGKHINIRVGLSWQKSEWEWKEKEKGKGIAIFALNVPLHGFDLLDNRIGRLHTNFQIYVTLSEKVLIFSKKLFTSTFKVEVEVKVDDTIWGKNQNFFYWE